MAARSLESGLSRALDPAQERPKLDPAAELEPFTTRWGQRYAIAHSPRSGAYLRLDGEAGDLAARMDGSRTVAELIVDDVASGGVMSPEHIVDVVALLRRSSLLTAPAVDTYAVVSDRLAPAPRRAMARAVRWFERPMIGLPGSDRFVDVVYRAGGRLCFTWWANAMAVATLLAGVIAFAAAAGRRGYVITSSVSTGTALSLAGCGLIALFVHEMGHALAVKRAGRRVIEAGFQLYLGNPAFFVDSSDMLLAPRRSRALNAAAGPYAEAVLAGVVSIAALLSSGGVGAFLFRLAAVLYLNVLLNLIPFIELDGYWLLTDVLDVPRLRPRAFAVLRYEVPARLRRRRHALTPVERALVAFGVFAAVFTVAALFTAWHFWEPVARRIVTALWRAGLGGRVVIVLLVATIAGPLLQAAAGIAHGVTRRAHGLIEDLRFRAQTSWRVEAAEAIAGLAGTDALDDDALSELAGRVTRRRFHRGAVVYRQGDAADAFFFVRHGTYAILEREVDDTGASVERLLRRARPGDHFGELALVEGGARSATVRAETHGEVFAVDSGTFERLLADRITAPAAAAAVRAAFEVHALRPFRRLTPQAAAMLAERGEWMLLGPGEEIDLADTTAGGSYYVVAAGHLDVLEDGSPVRTLRAGDHIGARSLVTEGAHTETLRTATRARLFRIDAEVFSSLIASATARGKITAASDPHRVSAAH
jgi:putative peptide zinc metalloprotease protein